ncbi:hypothetical protein K504DRAFT_452195 [Pleomassaria siparia CBS 279.74]|uniref:MYND-type domain-containing protein n=1 Tax=Pleomassaria siparia CBS 279.74 TaxID=1314801 RepID=A0A6G1JRR5_9PLEO|nr:hypothetical protein K504DRAFT_452195 [Pleomassaria siparia CBS 279.74]
MSEHSAQAQVAVSEDVAASSLVLGVDASDSQQQPQPETEPAPTPQACASCQKTLTLTTTKPCPRCHTTPYCSRECQKKDYKTHKKECAKLAQVYSQNAVVKMAVTRVPPKNEGRRGGLQKWEFDT